MAVFRYEVLEDRGESLAGHVEAESRAAAVHELLARGYHILHLEEEAPRRASFRRRMSLKQVAFVTGQLASLMRGGVPLNKALSVLVDQLPEGSAQETLKRIRNSVREGNPLSDALQENPRSFGPLYLSMVRAGETGGMLEETLTRLAELLYREVDLRGRVRSALAYPALMLTVGCITVFALLSFVIPKLTALFADVDRALPLPTLILVSVSGFFRSFWWVVLLLLVTAVLLGKLGLKTEKGRRFADRLLIRIPFLGELLLKSDMARFARVLGTLLRNGVTMIRALEVTSNTLANQDLRRIVREVSANIQQGDSLSYQMQEAKVFPPVMTNVVAVGEESGNLDDALLDLAEEYETELGRTVRTLVSMLEPALIIIVGGVVGFIVLAMLLPIFDLNEVIR